MARTRARVRFDWMSKIFAESADAILTGDLARDTSDLNHEATCGGCRSSSARTSSSKWRGRRPIRRASPKSRFLANKSHEPRTAMNAILGRSEMLMEQAQGPDLSMVEAGQMELFLESVDPEGLLGEVGGSVRALVGKRTIAVSSSAGRRWGRSGSSARSCDGCCST